MYKSVLLNASFIITFLLASLSVCAQKIISIHITDSSFNRFPYKNEIFYSQVITIDSFDEWLHINLDTVKEQWGSFRIVLFVKYAGKDSAEVTQSWTSDPHYICRYPKSIKHGDIISITLCCDFSARGGCFSKAMGISYKARPLVSFVLMGRVIPFYTGSKSWLNFPQPY